MELSKLKSVVAEDTLDPITRSRRKELAQRVQFARKHMNEGNQALIRTFPEFLFKRDFLDWISGQPVTYPDQRMAMWIELTGSPWMPINLTGPDGKVTIQVPALHNSFKFQPQNNLENRGSAGAGAMRAHLYAQVSPTQANTMLENVLYERVLNIVAPEEDIAEHEKWRKLYAHFGIDIDSIGKVKPNEAKPAADKPSDDGLEIEW
jgi:hypothetical protein